MPKEGGGYGGPGGSESTSFSAGFGEDGPSGGAIPVEIKRTIVDPKG